MKKILLFVICILLLVSMTACAARAIDPPQEFSSRFPVPPPSPEFIGVPDPIPEPEELEPEFNIMPLRSDIDPSRPMIALTFDDGPSIYTHRILDIFEEYGGRATFFVIGRNIVGESGALTRAVELGSEVAGHSWDHSRMTLLSEEEILHQLKATNNAIQEFTGIAPNIFRPPYGRTDAHLEEVSRNAGFALIDWSVDPRDWETRDAAHVYHEVMRAVRNGDIVVAHDIYPTTVEAMARIIPELLQMGYQLVTVTELLMHTHGEIVAGAVYKNGRDLP